MASLVTTTINGTLTGNSSATFDGRVQSNNELRVSNDYSVNYFYKTNNTTMLGYLLMRDNNNSFLSFPAAQDFRFLHGNTNRIAVKTDGNVGIGTTNPNQNLHVAGSTLITNNNYHYGFNADGAQTALVGIKSNNYVTLGQQNVNHAGTDIYSGTGSIYFYHQATNRLIISSDVNVQGATDLNINGSDRRLRFTSGTGTIRTTSANKLYLQTDSTDALTIDASQNVGIGTVSPSAKLQVAGNTYLNSGSNVWNLIGNNGINFARETYFGYSSSYRILQLGTVGATRAISIGVDVSSNASGSFGGDEIIFPNQREIITPNAADNGYLGLIATDNQNKVRIGNYRWNILNDTPGITIDTSTSANNVGIGTVSNLSTAKLDVRGNIYGQGFNFSKSGSAIGANISLTNEAGDASSNDLTITAAQSTNSIVLRAAQKVEFYTYASGGYNNRVVIANNGNVGIGTTNANASLHIDKAVPSIILETESNSGDPIITLKSNGPITGEGAQLWYDNSVGTLHIQTTYPNNAADIVFHTATGADKGTGNVRMVITGDGNVGINTTSPSYDLDVIGDISSNGQAIASYRRLRSYGTFTTSTSNTAGWYPLFSWGTTTGDRGGYRVYISYTGGSWAPNTTVLKVFKNWSNDATITIEKYGGTLYLPEVRIIGDATSATVYTLEVYLNALSTGHSFSVYYEALGYDEGGSSNVNWVNTSLALSSNTGSVIGSAKVSSEGIATQNLNINGDIYLADQLIHLGDSNTYFQFHNNDNMRLVANNVERFNIETAETVVNESGGDHDFRVEGDNDQNLLFVDAGTNSVGIGGTPDSSYKLDVAGDVLIQDGESGDLKILVNNTSTSTLARTAVALINNSGSAAGLTLPSTNYTGVTGWANRLILNTDSGISNGILVRPSTGGFTVSTTGFANPDLRVDTTGNVGIGTPSPTGGKLQVAGKVRIDAGSGNDALNLNAYDLLKWDGANLIHFGGYQSSQWQELHFYANGAKALSIDASQNVGIGTTNPGNYKLKVVGETHSTHFITGYDWAAKTGGLHIGNDGLTTGAVSFYNGSNSSANIYRNSDILYVGARAGVNTRGLAIDVNGNVGIGTAGPSAGLHVVNSGEPTVLFESTNAASSGSRLQLYHNSATPADNDIISNIQMACEDSSGAKRYAALIQTIAADVNASSVDGDIRFLTYKSNTASEVMRITHDKTVGIGTGTPSQKLHVQGNLRVTGAYYDSNNEAGTSNQVLTSTGSGGTDWKSISDISNTVTGSGTTNYVTKWSNGANSDLTNSLIYDNGTNVGISTASPSAKLHVHSTTGILHTGDDFSSWVLKYLSNQGSGSTVVNYYLIAAKTQTNVRFDGVLKGARQVGTSATGSGGARITFYTNNAGTPLATGGLESWGTDDSGYGHPIFTLVELTYNSVEYYAIEISPSTTWTAGFKHVQFEGYANNVLFTNLGTGSVSGVVEFSGQESVFSYQYGKLGIGTASPTSLLHIDTGANSAANFKLGANRTAANAAVGQMVGDWNGTVVSKIAFKTGDDTTNKDNGEIAFEVAAAGSTAEAMRIASNGKVGIGTTSPSTLLTLHQASDTNIGGLRIENSDNSSAFRVWKQSGGSGASVLVDNGVDTMFIKNGDVGIGTDDPNTKLHAYSSTAVTNERNIPIDVLTLETEHTSDTEYNGFGQGIVFRGSTYNQNTQRTLGRILHQINDDSVTTTRGTSMSFQTSDNGSNTNAPTTKVTIDYKGDVGIGTTSPDYELEVSTSSNSRIAATSVTNSVVNHLQADSSGAYVGPLSNHSLFIKTNNTTKMTILSGGNVGIGIASPGSKLDVNGMIKAGIAGNSSANTPALLVSSAGVNPEQSAIAIQQGTTEGDTIIFADYEPYVEWGLSTDNGLNTIEFTGGTNTNNLGSKTLYNQSGNARTAYKKAIVELASGNMSVGGSVGIGNTNPQGTLDLGNATGGKSIVWGGSSGTNHYTSIWSEYGTGSLVLAGGLKSSTSSADFIYPYTGTYGYAAIELDSFHDDGIKFYTAADAARTAGAVATKQERMRIDTSGNVGIGTTTPSYTLHTQGTIYASSRIGVQAVNTSYLATLGGSSDAKLVLTGSSTPYIRFQEGTTDRAYIQWNSTTDSLKFQNQQGDYFDFSTHDEGSMGLRLMGYSGAIWGYVYANSSSEGGKNIGLLDGGGSWAIRHVENTKTEWRIDNDIKMTLLASGNLGIGAASPTSKLQIVGSTSGDSVLRVDGTNGTLFEVVDDLSDSLMSVNDAAGLPVFEVFADNHIVAGRYNQNDFYLNTNGNLGLGTASPSTRLQVKDSVDNTYESGFSVVRSADGATTWINLRGGATNFNNKNHAGNAGLKYRWFQNSSEKMTLDTNGNVGIGTTDPTAKLDVRGTGTEGDEVFRIESDGNVVDGGYHWMTSEIASSQTTDANIIHLIGRAQNSKNSGYFGFNYQADAADSNFITLGGYAANHLLNITMGGNVGIGITNPDAKLEVLGDAIIGSAATKLKTYSDASYSGIFNGSTLGSDESIYFGSGATYFINNGSASLTIDSSRNVIVGNGGNGGGATIRPGGQTSVYALEVDRSGTGGSVDIWDNNDDSVIIGATSSEQTLTVKAGGKVGIGTTNPTEELYVVGRGRFTNGVVVPETTNGGFEYRTNSAWGGWARDAFTMANGTGGNFFSLGGYGGSGTTFTYGYIGKSYTDYCIRFYLDGGVNLTHNNNIKLSTTSTGVTVTGTLTANGDATVTGDLSAGGSAAANRTLTVNSVAQAGRPAARINNPNLDTTTASNGRTFHGWLPIDLDGTVKYIPVYN